MKIHILLILFLLSSTIQSQTDSIVELNILTKNEIIQLNSFLKSKELKRLYKWMYHTRPKFNYYNLNTNERCYFLERIDSSEIKEIGLDYSIIIPQQNFDKVKYWTSSQILTMRKWQKKSNVCIVFYRPESHIISFEIFRAKIITLDDKLYYSRKIGLTRTSLGFSLLLSENNYRIINTYAGIKD